ncbi:MAG: gliding motility-associated ABC transporter substrate-binding protein GldG [Bacteroidetes bacterium]|nr:gliding motility-associated ABC transporter substrate-binding protein GldG [Bacteroidota bacterium]MCL2302887.1 gliding motility-associated ABC transporter substrate-binding protein GldG [Lentimicrobiaceae bacterium]
MKNQVKYKRSAIITLVSSLFILVALNIIFSFFYTRIDLTAEKRNSLAPSTVKLIKELPDKIYIKVFLEGRNNPADYQIFAQKTKEILEEFSRHSSNIEFEMIDPIAGKDQEEVHSIFGEFYKKGLFPVPISREDYSTTWVVPGAFLTYRGKEYPVTLVVSDPNGRDWLDFSIQELEYNLVSAIRNITTIFAPRVAFIEGHGELDRMTTSWMEWQLRRYYKVDRVMINNQINSLREIYVKDSAEAKIGTYGNKYDVLIVAQPTQPFSDMDKYVIDQFIMNGGKVLWLIDMTNASIDSLQHRNEFFATEMPLRLNSLFFKYGVRLNANLVQDLNCQGIPIQSGMIGNQPQFKTWAFPYMPVIVNFSTHPITRKLKSLKFDFGGTIDFVGTNPDIRKTVLATTSEKTKVVPVPSIVTLNVIKTQPNLQEFSRMYEPVAVLVEGKFTSAFKGILPIEFDTIKEFDFKTESRETRQIFVSDGDVIRNRFDMKSMQPYPTGFDVYSQRLYDNTDFLLNCVNYLSADDELLQIRAKSFKLGTLNPVAVKEKKNFYILLNTIGPLALISIMATVLILFRKMKYSRKRLNA